MKTGLPRNQLLVPWHVKSLGRPELGTEARGLRWEVQAKVCARVGLDMRCKGQPGGAQYLKAGIYHKR